MKKLIKKHLVKLSLLIIFGLYLLRYNVYNAIKIPGPIIIISSYKAKIRGTENTGMTVTSILVSRLEKEKSDGSREWKKPIMEFGNCSIYVDILLPNESYNYHSEPIYINN